MRMAIGQTLQKGGDPFATFFVDPFIVRDATYSLTSTNFASVEIQFFPSNHPNTNFRRRIGGIWQTPAIPLGYDDSVPLQYVSGSTLTDQMRVVQEVDTPSPFAFSLEPFPGSPDGEGWWDIHTNSMIWRISNSGGPLGIITKAITFEFRANSSTPVGARCTKTLSLERTA